MLSKQGMTVKNYLKILLAVLIPIAAFPIHPRLTNANEYYRCGCYEKAYAEFSWFLFQHGRGCSDEDYYISLIGKNSCAKHMNSEEIFRIDRSFFSNLIEADLPDWQHQLLNSILKNSVYYDL